MRLSSILKEDQTPLNETIAENAVFVVENLQDMLDEVQDLRKLVDSGKLSEDDYKELGLLLSEMEADLDNDDIFVIAEGVDRQFRRYGDKFLRQYRCTSGDKAGRLVTSPDKCGRRKDPKRVRIGKRASRVKKGIRVRKSLFTKRKTQSKRLSRLNAVLRGDK